jgi:hypothetical protein
MVAMEVTWKPISRSSEPNGWAAPSLLSFTYMHIGTALAAAWWPKPGKGGVKVPKHFWKMEPPANDNPSWSAFREISAHLLDNDKCLKRTLPDGVEVAVLHTGSRGVIKSALGKLPSKSLIAITFDHKRVMVPRKADEAALLPSEAQGPVGCAGGGDGNASDTSA